MRSLTFLPKNMQILLLSRLKALSRVNTAIIELCGPVESVLSTPARKAYGDLDFIQSPQLSILQASSASAGLATAMPAMLVSGHRRVTTPITSCTGCGVCTHSPTGAESARLWTVQQHTVWPEERGVAARLRDLEFGTYFPAG